MTAADDVLALVLKHGQVSLAEAKKLVGVKPRMFGYAVAKLKANRCVELVDNADGYFLRSLRRAQSTIAQNAIGRVEALRFAQSHCVSRNPNSLPDNKTDGTVFPTRAPDVGWMDDSSRREDIHPSKIDQVEEKRRREWETFAERDELERRLRELLSPTVAPGTDPLTRTIVLRGPERAKRALLHVAIGMAKGTVEKPTALFWTALNRDGFHFHVATRKTFAEVDALIAKRARRSGHGPK